jgi:galactose oxidase
LEFPIVPVSAAVVYTTGQLVTWSSYLPNDFEGTSNGVTYTSTYDPATQAISEVILSNINHDMFCPGLSVDALGGAVVTGGNTAPATTIYQVSGGTWQPVSNMKIARGYQAQVTLSDTRIFTIGGSWSGGEGGKNGEIYNVTSNAWSLLTGAPVAPMLTADQQGVYRQDNHGWLFAWKNNYVFQAGPSKAMNWYGTTGNGSQTSAGTRASDTDSMCGNAVLYDAVAGKILTVGGSPNYQDAYATTNAHVITIGTPPAVPTVATIGNMAYARAFANGVVLPNGQGKSFSL